MGVRSLFLLILVGGIFLTSCNPFSRDKPINPKLIFTEGSKFLTSAKTIAIKGNILFEGDDVSQSGSFQILMDGRDSLYFLLEGPFKVDLFELLVLKKDAYAKSRDENEWIIFNENQVLDIPEYGLVNISPFALGVYILPQYFLTDPNLESNDKSLLAFENTAYYILQGKDKKRFSMFNRETNLESIYSNQANIQNGFYPAKIIIVPANREWKIEVEINKIKINPRIPDKIWLKRLEK